MIENDSGCNFLIDEVCFLCFTFAGVSNMKVWNKMNKSMELYQYNLWKATSTKCKSSLHNVKNNNTTIWWQMPSFDSWSLVCLFNDCQNI